MRVGHDVLRRQNEGRAGDLATVRFDDVKASYRARQLPKMVVEWKRAQWLDQRIVAFLERHERAPTKFHRI